MSNIIIKVNKATSQLVDTPVRIPRGGIRGLSLSFIQDSAQTLLAEGTLIVLELFAPGDLETAIAPGGTVNTWARNTDTLEYTASIDMSGPVLAALDLSTLFGRIRYTEPSEDEVLIDDFHVTPNYNPLPGAKGDTFRWEQIENPPDLEAIATAANATSAPAAPAAPVDGNYRILAGTTLQVVDVGSTPGFRSIWFDDGVLKIGELDES